MPTAPRWRKSSHSGQDASCVEVAHSLDALRDSKDPAGSVLVSSAVPALIRALAAGRLTSR